MRRNHKSTGTRGYYAYALLMRSLQVEPTSIDVLALIHDFTHNAVMEILRRLHRQQVVHIQAWERYERRGCGYHAIWALGQGVDAPKPPRVDGTESQRKRPERIPFRSQVFTFGQLMLALQDGHTPVSLCELTGLDRRWVDDLVGFMKEIKLVHVSEWHRNTSGSPSPVLKLGDKRSAPRPKPLPTEGRSAGYQREIRQREQWRSLMHMVAAPLPVAAYA